MHKYLVLTVLFIQSSVALYRDLRGIAGMNKIEGSYTLTAEGKPQRIGVMSLPIPDIFQRMLEKKFKASQKAKEDELNYYNSRTFVPGSFVKWLRSRNV